MAETAPIFVGERRYRARGEMESGSIPQAYVAARPTEPPLRPLSRRATWVTALLVLGIAVDVVAIASDALERSLLERIAGGELITQATADANDLRQGIVGVAQGALFVVTAVFFLAWFHRAYTNVRALGVGPLRFGPGWAIGAWFVPILSLWRPKQIANDIWRGSNPALPRDAGDVWNDPVPPLFLVWWIAWVVGQSLYTGATRLSLRADELDELTNATTIFLAADAVGALSGVLALVVVRRTTARQNARAAALEREPLPDPTPLWRRKSTWAAAGATLAAFALQGLLAVAAWRGSLGPTDQEAASPPPPSAPGVLLEDDFSRPGTWLVENDASLTFDYTGGAYRMLVKDATALWSSLQPLAREAASLSVEVDTSFVGGRVRTDYYGVGCVGSSQGGYLFGISPDGYYTIGFDPGGDQELEMNRIVEEQGAQPFRSGDAVNRLRADCRSEGERAVLSLYVNGSRLVERTHRSNVGRFVGILLFVFSGRGGTEARFDDVVVRELPAG